MSPGRKKWASLLAYILLLEVLPGDTLTRAHQKAILNPIKRWPILVTHAYIVAHLWDLIPRRYDPLVILAELTHINSE